MRGLPQVSTAAGSLQLSAAAYQLVLPADRPYAYLNSPTGERLAELFIGASVHPWQGRDDTVSLGEWQVTPEDEAGELWDPDPD